MPTATCEVTHEEIARRAYELWQARGCPAGDGNADWDAAVAELTSERRNGSGGLVAWLRRMRESLAAGRNN
jgi:hypothetical protein